jgi:ASC-1-like (ASCH) protein
MKIHELKLTTKPFEAIKNGSKTIESRLYDDKRQLIGLGDELIFTNREHPEQTVKVKVIGLLRYESFESLFTHNNPTNFGGPSIMWLLSQVREFYPLEEEQKYGVVGIEFVLV